MSEKIVITGATRTQIGGFQGVLSDATASQLGAAATGLTRLRSSWFNDPVAVVAPPMAVGDTVETGDALVLPGGGIAR